MISFKALGLGVALACLAPAAMAVNTTLRLTNGSVVIGEIVRQEGGKIYFKAELLGDLVIKESDVVESPSASAPERGTAPLSNARGVRHAASGSAAPSGAQTQQKKAIRTQNAQNTEIRSVSAHPVASGEIAAPEREPGKKGAVWAGTVTVAGSYVSAAYRQGVVPGTIAGVTGAQLGLAGTQKTLQVSAEATRTTPTDLVGFYGSYGYAEYQPAPSAVVDNYSALLAWNHMLGPKDFAAERTIYMVDNVRHIFHSFVQIVGVGHKWIDQPNDKLDLVPGAMLSNERKDFIYDDRWKVDYGLIENYTHNFNPYVSLDQRLIARTLINRSSFYVFNAYAGFTAMIFSGVGLKIGFNYDFDNSAPYQGLTIPGVPAVFYPSNKGLFTITTGIQYKFGSSSK